MQPLRNHYAMLTQCLRKVYAIQLRSITQLFYAIVLRNCFTQLLYAIVYAIVLRRFTQLFYAVLRMSVNEIFTQKSCHLRKGQLADVPPLPSPPAPFTPSPSLAPYPPLVRERLVCGLDWHTGRILVWFEIAKHLRD